MSLVDFRNNDVDCMWQKYIVFYNIQDTVVNVSVCKEMLTR